MSIVTRLLIVLFISASAGLSGARAEAPMSAARFTQLCAEAARKALPSAKVEITGELALRVAFPNGRHATPYLDNAFAAYRQNPERRDDIIAFYINRALKNLADDDLTIDLARVIPIVRGRDSMMVVEAEKDPVSPHAVVSEHFGADLVIIYGENRPQDLRFFTAGLFKKTGFARSALRTLAIGNLRRMIGTIEYRDYGGAYMLIADGANEASLLLLPEIWSKQKLKVDGDFIVAIPTRDLLVVTGSNDADAIGRVRALAQKAFADGPYSISAKLYRYRDGKLAEF